jgi:hypothetical protein
VKGEALLRASASWRLLGLLFERPRPGWADEVARLAAPLDAEDLREAASHAAEVDEGMYLSWFGPGGAASPREVAYRGWEDPGRVLSDLATFYDAFAFRPRAEDPLDHVAVLSGFVGYLWLKEGYAAQCGRDEEAHLTAEARGKFAGEHLRPVAGPMLRKLSASGAPRVWEHAAAALVRRVGDVPDPLPVASPDDDAMECPGATG